MRLQYDNKHNNGDGFSTSFSDLVFGLLFVFFLLSIALIFQRPEVDQFQDRIDGMEHELKESRTTIMDTKKLNEKLLSENKRLTSRISSLIDDMNKLKSILERKNKAIKIIRENHKKLKNRLSVFKIKVQKQAQDYKDLKVKYDRLKKYSDKKASQKIKKMSGQLRKLKNKEKKLARAKAELESILGSVKKLLRTEGYMEVLAELEEMQKKLEGRGKGQGEEKVSSPSRIQSKYDPNAGFVEASVEYSPSEHRYFGELKEQDILDIAEELKQEYKLISESYTELEKRENRPKLYLSIHPDTPHWQVQEILAKIKSTILVVIVPWE